jgi:hypothetical protein
MVLYRATLACQAPYYILDQLCISYDWSKSAPVYHFHGRKGGAIANRAIGCFPVAPDTAGQALRGTR